MTLFPRTPINTPESEATASGNVWKDKAFVVFFLLAKMSCVVSECIWLMPTFSTSFKMNFNENFQTVYFHRLRVRCLMQNLLCSFKKFIFQTIIPLKQTAKPPRGMNIFFIGVIN